MAGGVSGPLLPDRRGGHPRRRRGPSGHVPGHPHRDLEHPAVGVLPPIGRSFVVDHMHIHRVRDGRIVQHWGRATIWRCFSNSVRSRLRRQRRPSRRRRDGSGHGSNGRGGGSARIHRQPDARSPGMRTDGRGEPALPPPSAARAGVEHRLRGCRRGRRPGHWAQRESCVRAQASTELLCEIVCRACGLAHPRWSRRGADDQPAISGTLPVESRRDPVTMPAARDAARVLQRWPRGRLAAGQSRARRRARSLLMRRLRGCHRANLAADASRYLETRSGGPTISMPTGRPSVAKALGSNAGSAAKWSKKRSMPAGVNSTRILAGCWSAF
jgi:hypothetical protein